MPFIYVTLPSTYEHYVSTSLLRVQHGQLEGAVHCKMKDISFILWHPWVSWVLPEEQVHISDCNTRGGCQPCAYNSRFYCAHWAIVCDDSDSDSVHILLGWHGYGRCPNTAHVWLWLRCQNTFEIRKQNKESPALFVSYPTVFNCISLWAKWDQ